MINSQAYKRNWYWIIVLINIVKRGGIKISFQVIKLKTGFISIKYLMFIKCLLSLTYKPIISADYSKVSAYVFKEFWGKPNYSSIYFYTKDTYLLETYDEKFT